MEIQGKVAIVTGGSQGIGKGMTEELLRRGAKVVIADVKDGSSVAGFDILVNNAGVGGSDLWNDTDRTQLDRVMLIDLISVMDFSRVAVRFWNARGQQQSAIVNVASNMAFFPAAYGPGYGAAKAGVVHFTATCASLAPRIRVNAVAPNYADTSMF
ncbi:3-oxoacyl-[acyl-carrier-protein] reductase FabG, partial [Smittium mucronatum]